MPTLPRILDNLSGFTLERILIQWLFKKKTLGSLSEGKVHGSRDVVVRRLEKSLGGKRYLLVLDDLWDEDNAKWENFIKSLKGISHVEGNVIMVTTRQGKVASIVKTLNVHKLGVLSGDHCCSIIRAMTFGEDIPLEFEIVGKNVADKCGGLPLAAQVLGSILNDVPIHEWDSTTKEWHSRFGWNDNSVSKILMLSFDHLLTPSIKKCFALCSLIPKRWWIEKDEFIQLWMAECLLETDHEKDLEDVGNIVFNILTESSLLKINERDLYGNVTSCLMHDFVHDLASSVLNSRYLDGAHQVRYISRPSIDESYHIPEENVKCLRALFFTGRISNIMFSKFRCLHILTLNDDEMKELPIEIGKLISLRYLDISHTRIECLPDSIGDLYLLQTLRTTMEHGGPSHLKSLPPTSKYLISLRHLYISNIELPLEIGKLTSLQTLPYFKVSDQGGCRITELGNLKNLKGDIEIHNLEKVCDKEEAKGADLFHKSSILKLKLVWNEPRDHATNDENVLEGLQPHWNLKSIEIKGFKGSSFPLWTLRMEVRKDVEDCWIRLDNLLKLKLSDCEECEEVPMLGHLRSLKYLYFCNLPKVKHMGSSFYGIEKDKDNYTNKIVVFPALEKLELNDMPNLNLWTEVSLLSSSRTQPREVSVFSCLKYLKISNCKALMNAPSHFPSLKELEIVNMESGLPLANICGSKLTSLTNLTIHKVDGLVCLPDELFNINCDLLEVDISDCNNLMHLVPSFGGGGVSLKSLMIEYCSGLKELPEDLYKLNALEELRIWGCPNLKSLPYPSGGKLTSKGFTSVRTLHFHNCTGLTNFPCEMLERCLSSLEEFRISRSRNITNLPQMMSILKEMPRLTCLAIHGVPKFFEVIEEIGTLFGLQTLSIGAPPDCWNYVSWEVISNDLMVFLQSLPEFASSRTEMPETSSATEQQITSSLKEEWDYVPFKGSLDYIFPVLHSLRELALYGMEHWNTVPDQIQHLTTLRRLYIVNFGIEVLPEWIGNLSSLTALYLYGCPKLMRLASKEAMLSLTNLTEFQILDCPLLKQNVEQKASDDSEWFKIFHIRDISVD